MALTIEEIRVKLDADVAGFTKKINGLNSVTRKFVLGLTVGENAMKKSAIMADFYSQKLNKVKATINKIDINKSINPAVAKNAFTLMSDGVNKFGKEIDNTRPKFRAFSGQLLSIMFFGMQMKKVFTDALTGIFEGYKKVIPETSAFNLLTTKLSANWEFFKFQLAEALGRSDLFKILIGYAISLVQAFQELPTGVKEMIVWLTAVGVVLGGILFSVGVIGLGMLGISSTVSMLAGATGFAALGLSIGKIFKYKWSDLGTSIGGVKPYITDLIKGMNSWRELLKLSWWKNKLTNIGTMFSNFSKTIVGSAVILGSAFLLAMKISEYGVEKFGMKYKSTWATILGTTIDIVGGIIILVASIPAALYAVGKIMIDMWASVGDAMKAALLTAIMGGDVKSVAKAFSSEMSKVDPAQILADTFTPIGQFSVMLEDLKENWNLLIPVDDTTADMQKLQDEQDKLLSQLEAMNTGYSQLNSKMGETINPLTGDAIYASTPSESNNETTNNIQNTIIIDGFNQSVNPSTVAQGQGFIEALTGDMFGSGAGL